MLNSSMWDVLLQIDHELDRLAPELAARLRSGRRRDEIEAVGDRYGLLFPEDLVTWFSWHDGQDTPPGKRSIPLLSWGLLSLDESAARHELDLQIWREVDLDLHEKDGARLPDPGTDRLFPFLAADGDRVCVDCPADGSATNAVHYVPSHDWDRPRLAASPREFAEILLLVLRDPATHLAPGMSQWEFDMSLVPAEVARYVY